MHVLMLLFFFFNDTATTEIYTLSLHDALPIFRRLRRTSSCHVSPTRGSSSASYQVSWTRFGTDRKSTRLNSSHGYISYAVFCLKKKRKNILHDAIHTYLQHL